MGLADIGAKKVLNLKDNATGNMLDNVAGEDVIPESVLVETDIDKVYEFVLEKKSVPLAVLAERFKISSHRIENWARMLDNQGLLELSFSVMGSPELRTRAPRNPVKERNKQNQPDNHPNQPDNHPNQPDKASQASLALPKEDQHYGR